MDSDKTDSDKMRGMLADPRPDLGADSKTWARLLAQAYDGRVFDLLGALHGARALGARLGRAALGCELTCPHPDYGDLRARWLLPHAAALGAMLGAL